VSSKSQETNKKSASRNIRFIQAAICIVKSAHLKPYSCKFSKKIYTQNQLLVLILFKDFRNQHYREFIEDVGDMAGVQEILDLSEVPHFTTLQKFISRIKSLCLRITFRKTVSQFYSKGGCYPNNGNRFIGVYQRILQPLFFGTSRETLKTFHKNVDICRYGSTGYYRIYLLE